MKSFEDFRNESIAKLESMRNHLNDDIEKIRKCKSESEIVSVRDKIYETEKMDEIEQLKDERQVSYILIGIIFGYALGGTKGAVIGGIAGFIISLRGQNT